MAENKDIKIVPWEDVLITVDAPEDRTEQGVILPGASQTEEKKKPDKGIVVAVGPQSKEVKTSVKANIEPGDLVYYERYTTNAIPDGGHEYNFVRFKYIMGYKKKSDL